MLNIACIPRHIHYVFHNEHHRYIPRRGAEYAGKDALRGKTGRIGLLNAVLHDEGNGNAS